MLRKTYLLVFASSFLLSSGFGFAKSPKVNRVRGTVSVPKQDIKAGANLAASKKISPRKLGALAGAEVKLIRIDENGNELETLASTITNAKGRYQITVPEYSSLLKLKVENADRSGRSLEALAVDKKVDINTRSTWGIGNIHKHGDIDSKEAKTVFRKLKKISPKRVSLGTREADFSELEFSAGEFIDEEIAAVEDDTEEHESHKIEGDWNTNFYNLGLKSDDFGALSAITGRTETIGDIRGSYVGILGRSRTKMSFQDGELEVLERLFFDGSIESVRRGSDDPPDDFFEDPVEDFSGDIFDPGPVLLSLAAEEPDPVVEDDPAPAPVSDEPAPTPVSDEPAPPPVEDDPAPAPITDEPAPAPIADEPPPVIDEPPPAPQVAESAFQVFSNSHSGGGLEEDSMFAIASGDKVVVARPGFQEAHSFDGVPTLLTESPGEAIAYMVGDDIIISTFFSIITNADIETGAIYFREESQGSFIATRVDPSLSILDLDGEYGFVGQGLLLGKKSIGVGGFNAKASSSAGSMLFNFNHKTISRSQIDPSNQNSGFVVSEAGTSNSIPASASINNGNLKIQLSSGAGGFMGTKWDCSANTAAIFLQCGSYETDGGKISNDGEKMPEKADIQNILGVKLAQGIPNLAGKEYRLFSTAAELLNSEASRISSLNPKSDPLLAFNGDGTASFSNLTRRVVSRSAERSARTGVHMETSPNETVVVTLGDDGSLSFTLSGRAYQGFISADLRILVLEGKNGQGLTELMIAAEKAED